MGTESKNDIITFYGKCRFCLDFGYMKNIWTEHQWENVTEVYGEMLKQTYSLTLRQLEDTKDYICEMCVIRLRDAYKFRKQILTSDNAMAKTCEDLDHVEEETSKEQLEEYEEYDEVFVEYEKLNEDLLEDNDVKESNEYNTEYFDVEYLEEELEKTVDKNYEIENTNTDDTYPSEYKPKKSKRKRSRPLLNRYKTYTDETMQECVEMVRSGQMNIREASVKYGVPQRTLNTKIRLNETEITKANVELAPFIAELRKIFTFTNAIPFKTKICKFACPYCVDIEYFYDDSDELRKHVLTHDLTKNIEKALRPKFMNQILRVDIEDFSCKQCEVALESWNDMFVHLKEQHDLEFDIAYTKVIPYILKGDLKKCALCNQSFPNFTYLDIHMNTHYCNYMCSECGDTFLTDGRLKSHLTTHNTGKFPCYECGKIFTLDKYMRKHVATVHKNFKSLKCMYCPERYRSELQRHSHVLEKHKERVKISTCEYCGKKFDWKPYYLQHIRKVHTKEKKHQCAYCERRFVARNELVLHEQRHTGTGKHMCPICGNNYVTMMELRSHMRRHEKEASQQ